MLMWQNGVGDNVGAAEGSLVGRKDIVGFPVVGRAVGLARLGFRVGARVAAATPAIVGGRATLVQTLARDQVHPEVIAHSRHRLMSEQFATTQAANATKSTVSLKQIRVMID